MRNKKLVLALGLIVLLGAGLAVSRQQSTGQSKTQSTQRESANIPDYALYGILFHDVHLRKQQALKLEDDGKPDKASAWRDTYKRDAQLNAGQATALEQVAEQCEMEVALQDAKARVIIERDKARYPGGKVPPGETVQPPSPELVTMQEERNAIILRHRDRLRDILGEIEFARFQDFLHRKLAPQITITSATK